MERNLLEREVNALKLLLSPLTKPTNVVVNKISEENTTGCTCYVEIDIELNKKNSTLIGCKKDAKGNILKDESGKNKCSYVKDTPQKMIAIYVPDSFKTDSESDVIVYLHGHLKRKPGINPNNTSPSIQQYLNYSKADFFDFRRIINQSGKNIVLVAPTLGPRSQYGNLATHFDDFISQVLDAINQYIIKERNLQGSFKLGRIIVASHSGGGKGMLDIMEIANKKQNQYARLVTMLWGFDSWYDYKKSSFWDELDKSAKTFGYYYDGQSGLPPKRKNIDIVPSKIKDHFKLLPYYFKERINAL